LGGGVGCGRAIQVAACGVLFNERRLVFKVTCGFVLSLTFCAYGYRAGVSSLDALYVHQPAGLVSYPSFLNEAFTQPRRFSPTESDDEMALSP